MNIHTPFPFLRAVVTVIFVGVLLFGASCAGGVTSGPGTAPTASPPAATQPPPAATTQATTVPPESPSVTPAAPEDQGTTVPAAPQLPTATGYPIKVYFSKFPDSLSNVQAVSAVDRISPTIMVGTYALQLLIAGPTPKEWDAGAFSELNSILSGPSTCAGSRPVGGPDLTLILSMRGTHPQQGTATVRFCRTTASPGIGADARITVEITATLKQFPSIQQVVILTKDGHCFGDESGKDSCLA